jgi:hypothetical protein
VIRIRNRLGSGHRVVLVIGLGAALTLAGDYLTSFGGAAGQRGIVVYTGGSRSELLGTTGTPAWVRLVLWLLLITGWAVVSLFLLRDRTPAAARPAAREASPVSRLGNRLAFSQRVILIVGLGAALVVLGDYIVGLAVVVPQFGNGLFYSAPLAAAGPFFWPDLVIRLVLAGAWAAASLFLLRRRAKITAST